MDSHFSPMPPLGAFFQDGLPLLYLQEVYPADFGYTHSIPLDGPNSTMEGAGAAMHALGGIGPAQEDAGAAMGALTRRQQFEEIAPGSFIPNTHGPSRQRRRPPLGSEHVKHRRTRSGCYTCRQRRVKCDETHPICDRCRKGKRECTYPGEPSSATSTSSRNGGKSKGSDDVSSDSEDEQDGDSKAPLSSITDEDEETESEPQSARSDVGEKDVAFTSRGKQELTVGLRASARPSNPRTTSKVSVKPTITQHARWSTLPRDVKAYLKYHSESMSYHHYGFKYDGGDFLKTTFLEIAIIDENHALLYGIVAFAAYHHAFSHQEDISRFLQFYNKSITLLQQALQRKRHTVSTLLTILQLATIEEFLGDWTNLLGHQRAAHQLLTNTFAPENIMRNETTRRIISWYLRFDLFAGLMAGSETQLGREWFAACADFYSARANDRPDDLGARFENYFSVVRLMATDITLLFAAKKKGSVSDADFSRQVQEIHREISATQHELETAFTDASCFVKTFPNAPPPSADDITDYREPGFLYGGELFTMNFVLIDFLAVDLTFKLNIANAQQQPPPPELSIIALRKCKIFEAIQYYDYGPPGALLGCQASLGIASLCVPQDQKHIDWCRRKFASIEQLGYIYPAALRQRVSAVWGIDVNHWWLPNEEGYPRVVRAIRDFISYRASIPKDPLAVNVRDMTAILQSLNLREESSPPGDLKSTGTDSEAFDSLLDSSMGWESSLDA